MKGKVTRGRKRLQMLSDVISKSYEELKSTASTASLLSCFTSKVSEQLTSGLSKSHSSYGVIYSLSFT